MMMGGESKPSTSRPLSSFDVGFIGPSRRFMPFSRAQAFTAENSCRLTSASFTHSKNPKKAVRSFCTSLWV